MIVHASEKNSTGINFFPRGNQQICGIMAHFSISRLNQAGSAVLIDAGLGGKLIAGQVGVAGADAAVFHADARRGKRIGDVHIVPLELNITGMQKIRRAPVFLVKATSGAYQEKKQQEKRQLL